MLSVRNVQGTDITYRQNVQGQTLQPIYCISAHKTSFLYRCLLNQFIIQVYTENT